MAARGNRSGGLVPVGLAFFATVAAALGLAQSAFAQDAPPPPPAAESASTGSTPAPPPPAESPPADTSPSGPPPAATPPDPAPTTTAPTESSSTEPSAPKPADAPATQTTSATTTTPTETKPTETKPASGSSTDAAAAANAVKLEAPAPATTTAPAAPAATGAPAAQAAPPAATPPSGAPPPTSVVLVAGPAPAAAQAAAPATSPTSSPAANEEAVEQVAAVSLHPRSAVALEFDDAPAVKPVKRAAAAAPTVLSLKTRTVRQACIRPHGLVPLSQRCRLVVRAPAAPRGVLTYATAPSPEVRAAIDRGAAQAAADRAKAAPPPESKAAQERPIPKIRPILPFGGVALGALQDGFGGVAGSASSSRIFALAALPLRVPRPFQLARLRLPTAITHGVIAAPPPTRPG